MLSQSELFAEHRQRLIDELDRERRHSAEMAQIHAAAMRGLDPDRDAESFDRLLAEAMEHARRAMRLAEAIESL